MPDTQFVVERLNWRRSGGTLYLCPGTVRVAAFPTADEAERLRAAREAGARAAVNPFAANPWASHSTPPADQTTLPEPVFRDWLLDHGVDPPAVPPAGKSKSADWAKWWADGAVGWPPETLAAVWQALDRVRFYRVVERPARAVAYAVVEVVWGYDDYWWSPVGPEGGQSLAVYRSRANAEAEAARRTAASRDTFWRPDDPLDIGDRDRPGAGPFEPPPPTIRDGPERPITLADAPLYEVVEVEWEGPS